MMQLQELTQAYSMEKVCSLAIYMFCLDVECRGFESQLSD